MSQIQDHDQTELERSLPDRLRRSAEAATPDPDALTAVRARAAGRRRRGRITMVATSAAAVAVIAAGVVVATGDEPSTGVTAGPADGGAPTTVTPPVPAEQLDATLVIYRYPNATPEMIAQDPKMGGEWAMLFTAGRVYFANGPVDEMGALSPWSDFDLDGAIAAIDANRSRPPAEIVAALAATGSGINIQRPGGSGHVGDDAQITGMMELIATGSLGGERAAIVTAALEGMPGVEVQRADGGATVTVSSVTADHFVTYRAQDGVPLRKGSLAVEAAQMEYLSVTPVRASDHLVPGRGTPNAPSTTTTVPG